MALAAQGRLFIVANAGRSGSTYLWDVLKRNRAAESVFHENIPVRVSQPRRFNRAYKRANCTHIQSDPELKEYLLHWDACLDQGDVIETGWTIYHLLPILYERFGDRIRLIILHRDPWSVALSRANLGNYHSRSWYDSYHEVSPYDSKSIAPEYKDIWHDMNYAEKCLFWWYVIYREIDEFVETYDKIPRIEISAHALFDGDGVNRISDFLGKPLNQITGLERNPVHRFMRETFPISDEHTAFGKHVEINAFAKKRFNYDFVSADIDQKAQKYRLPNGMLPRFRNRVGYWSHRRRLGNAIRAFSGR